MIHTLLIFVEAIDVAKQWHEVALKKYGLSFFQAIHLISKLRSNGE